MNNKLSLKELLEREGTIAYTNVGISMLPWIHEGKDIIIVDKIQDKPKKWDVVLFRRPNVVGRGEYVLHRVMKVLNNGSYFIIGDNTPYGEIVLEENILGILRTIKQPNKTINVTDKDFIIKSKLYYIFVWPIFVHFKFIFKTFIKKIIFFDKWRHLVRK